MRVEDLSKPSNDGEQAGELDETIEEMIVMFLAGDKSMIALEPGDRPFNFPSPAVATKRSTVLKRWTFTAASMRTDQLDMGLTQSASEPICIGRPIIDQASGNTLIERRTDERFHHVDFGNIGTHDHRRQWNALTIDHQTDLGPFAFLRQADAVPPFFAGENVASAMHSSQRSCFKASSLPSSLNQAF